MRFTWAVAGLGLTMSLLAPISASADQPVPPPLGLVAPDLLTAAPAGSTSSLPVDESAGRQRLATLGTDPDRWQVGSRFTFNPFDGIRLDATVTQAEGSGDDRSWSGTLGSGGTFEAARFRDALRLSVHDDAGEFEFALDTDDPAGHIVQYKAEGAGVIDEGPGASTGAGSAHEELPEAPPGEQVTVPAPVEGVAGETVTVSPLGDEVSQRRAAKVRRIKPVLWSSRQGNLTMAKWGSLRLQAPRGGSAAVIDEWVQFTPQALAAKYGGSLAQAEADVRTEVNQLNQVLVNSQVPTRVELKKVSVSPSPQRSTVLGEYQALANTSDGYLDNIWAQRRAGRFDHLTQVINRANSDPDCGRGTLGGTDRISLTTIGANCFDGRGIDLAYAHEFGHNLGGQHDRGSGGVEENPSGYNYGYIDPAKRFRTVMSYDRVCPVSTCTWVPMFSSSTLKYKHNGTWLPTGNATTDNARMVRNWTPTLANTAPDRMYAGEIAVGGYARAKTQGLTVNSSAWLPWSTTLSPAWYVKGRLVSRSRTFKPTPKQVGKKVQVVVTGSAPGYPSVRTASPSWRIQPALMRVGRTRYSGRGRVGNVLRIRRAATSPRRTKVSVVWKSGSRRVGRGMRYRVKRSDAHRPLTAVVSYRKRGYKTVTIRVRWSWVVR